METRPSLSFKAFFRNSAIVPSSLSMISFLLLLNLAPLSIRLPTSRMTGKSIFASQLRRYDAQIHLLVTNDVRFIYPLSQLYQEAQRIDILQSGFPFPHAAAARFPSAPISQQSSAQFCSESRILLRSRGS